MDAEDKLLEGWQAIAHHLGVSVRTAQGYERTLALPVQRTAGQDKSRVRITLRDITEWQRQRNLISAANTAPQRTPIQERRGKRTWVVVAGAMVAILGALGAYRAQTGGNPSALRTEGRAISVVDERGRTLWTYVFPLSPSPPAAPGDLFSTRPVFTDLDGDGDNELLFPYSSAERIQDPHVLYCFDARGKVRWTHRLGRELKTRSSARIYPAHYQITWAITLSRPGQGGGRIVLGGNCGGTSLFGVELLAPDGRVTGNYYHPGWLWAAAASDLDGDGSDELLLGGVNDAFGNLPSGQKYHMTMVVLSTRAIWGQGPAPAADDRHFAGLAEGAERAVLLLPEFGALPTDRASSFSLVRAIRPRVNGFLDVLAIRPNTPEFTVEYLFDSRLRLNSVNPSAKLQQLLYRGWPDGLTQRDRVDRARRELGDILVLKNELDRP
jgi:hypothetical protein